jgi:hypothetical protein
MATDPSDGASPSKKPRRAEPQPTRRPKPDREWASESILPPEDAAKEVEQFKRFAMYLFAFGGALIGAAMAFTVFNVSFGPHPHPATVTDKKGQEHAPTAEDLKRWDENDALHERLIFTDHLRGTESVVIEGRRFDLQMLWLLNSALIFLAGACLGAVVGGPLGLVAFAAVQKNRSSA